MTDGSPSIAPGVKTHRNLRIIVELTMYHSLMVLAMDFVSYDGLLSIVSQDTINPNPLHDLQGSSAGYHNIPQ